MDGTSTPLADYFWIAGIENITYHDNDPVDHRPVSTLQLDDTIKEDNEHENGISPTSSPKNAAARHSRRNSFNRLSKASNDLRFSIQTVGEEDGTRSNRSSATIRPISTAANDANGVDDAASPTADTPTTAVPPSVSNGMGFTGLPDFDFDKALMKFAAERENFLDDLSFSAGAKLQARPPMVNNLRAERIKADESDAASGRMSPLRSIKGSIRRKISFRDMNSTKRQTTTIRQRPGRFRCRSNRSF